MTTTRAERHLSPGDLVLMEFGPTLGAEQDGRRPALVISVGEMHEVTRRAIVCPITGNISPWTTKVLLPDGLPISGAVLTDQVRSIDRRARILRWLGTAPERILTEVRYQVDLLIGLSPSFQIPPGSPP